ncbi:uncharacterized protein C16orf92 homolog isoform X2 [Mastomys coucha]|uniref:uncharacterized protein C16orf92 homolog isoform X2 n=1 Tax=Mastomys coucha TaxID=35658 RepID=UPI00126187C7|nr:uncharacterized protein C16orf92 homolog isoform X2 [Mastomys coucha]
MKLWQWVTMGVWLWMAELGTIETAPRRDRTRPLVPKASTKLFVDRPDFFDYPDSDRASLHAVARFIGEKPVIFIKTEDPSLLCAPPHLISIPLRSFQKGA